MKSRGFTLLEVLVALFIVALAVGALLGTVTSSASNIDYLRQKTLAEWVALNRLTEIRIAQQMPDKGKRTGNSEMAGMRWQWEEEVIELPVKGLFRVEVRARATGEPVDDSRPLAEPTAQKDPESHTAGSELDKLAWTTSAIGVVGSSQSPRRNSIGAAFIGLNPQAGAPNNPGGPKGAPGQNPPRQNPTTQPVAPPGGAPDR
jgi:general secretion pathway protein I